MGYVVRMPQLGMSMDEGVIVDWQMSEGDTIEADEVLVVVESEKASHDVESRETGVLRSIVIPEGSTVEPGTPIGIVAAADEDLSEYEAQIDTSVEEKPDDETDSDDGTASSAPAEEQTVSSTPSADTTQRSSDRTQAADVRATPGARQLAEQNGVDLTGVDGTGPQGVITESDVEEALEEGAGEVVEGEEDSGAPVTVTDASPLSQTQQTIANRLRESYQEAVHVTLNRTFDASVLRSVADSFEECSITDAIITGVAAALSSSPSVNAHYVDGEHRLIDEVNVGFAVDAERGLLTPVIPNADELTITAIADERRALTEKVQSGEFSMADLSGGTFTITNLGMFGIDDFDPIINPPQIAILGVGRIRSDGSMTVSLSFDHRVINGANAARFLDSIVDNLTDESALIGDTDVARDPDTSLADREVHVERSTAYSGTYRTAYGDVTFDEPADLGGGGTAPSPVDHLLGAIGSCLSVTITQLARRDDISIDSHELTVTGSPDTGPLESVAIEIEFDTDVSDDVLDDIVTKAERGCYVARTLTDDLSVTAEWTRADR